MLVSFEEEFPVLPDLVETSHLLIKLRVYHQMEVIVDLLKLSNVLVLHLPPRGALAAGVIGLREADLVDNDVVDVNLKLG